MNFVFEVHEWHNLPSLLCILASVLQILHLRATVLFALQELMLCHFPKKRVWIMLHFLLEPLDVPREYHLCRNEIIDSTFFCVRTQLQVSPRLLGNVMILTQSFPCRSDKLMVGLHLLLFPVGTVVKPADLLFAHRPHPIQEGESQLNHESTSYSVCGRTSV